ncbi:prephenate dehydrogenase [Salinilacihabitans rarus]|uniref:prephenate dehydrogenase n=1 Tax=Salinilacihabitans rarus TaxID=2961596 RepID=UPI0020C850D1|nr:prephenate dehydrogenase [Salinilacihabitans rarus]
MDVLIVGAGSMGTWFGRAVDASVTFADVDPDAAAAAAEAVGGAVGGDVDSLAGDGEGRYDAVCLAVPMGAVERAIEAHADRAERALVDVSGAMAPPLSAMAERAPDRERVSLHPLFAPERAPGSIAVVRDRAGPVTDALLADLEARGNDLVETTAAEHDEAMESVQAAAHAAVLAFALAADPVPEGFETPVYEELRELVEVVTDGTPRVYADVQRTFEGAADVAEAAAALAAADDDEFARRYREAAEKWRDDAADGDRGADDAGDANGGDGA